MIVSINQLQEIRRVNRHKTIVFCGGVFDLVHTGHVKFLETAKSYGDLLVVGICPDVLVRLRKGKTRPIIKEGERLKVIDAFRSVDYVLLLPKKRQRNLPVAFQVIEKLRPDYFFAVAKEWTKYADWYRERGVQLISENPGRPNSTTRIIKKICRQQTLVGLSPSQSRATIEASRQSPPTQ